MGIKYYKGMIEAETGMTRAFFAVKDKPTKDIMGDDVQVIANTFEGKGNIQYASIEECESAGCCLSREIHEEEYKLYKAISMLTNEIYMNQYTGGFPRFGVVEKLLIKISRLVRLCMSRQAGRNAI